MRGLIAGVLFYCILHGTATAQTAHELLSGCELVVRTLSVRGDHVGMSNSPAAATCWSFIAALQDFASITEDGKRTLWGQCLLPTESTTSQLIRVFVNYAQMHPEELNQRPSMLVLKAFTQAFPCER